MIDPYAFLGEHQQATRRYFLGLGAAGAAAWSLHPLAHALGAERAPLLTEAIEKLESYLTRQEDFRDVSRGKPKPHSLPEEKRNEVGLTRDSWRLEVISDPDKPAVVRNPLTRKQGNALDFAGLMKLAKRHAVRFPKVMTCNNIGCPLGMGVWEGVPVREVLWLTKPRRDLRRIFYWGYHNKDPKQMFRSSLPIGRVLEEPFGLPPIVLCYKLNGEWLNPERGGPVRLVVPEAYGFKSIKWLTTIVLSNLFHANDTYANGNNDVDSWLKTFAATLSVPGALKPGQPFPLTGYAQVGISGLSKVQYWVQPEGDEWDSKDPYYSRAPWKDAQILPPPKAWGGEIGGGSIPQPTIGFDPQSGRPKRWPLPLTKAHWAALLPGLPEGEFTLRVRSIDQNGRAQPMPRPFDKSGRVSIEEKELLVEK